MGRLYNSTKYNIQTASTFPDSPTNRKILVLVGCFPDNLVGLGFLYGGCFLYKINPNPRNSICCGK